MNETALHVKNFKVAINGRTILRDVSFSINKGEFVGIIGPNGAGKSTLLRGMRSLIPVADGSVDIYGQPVKQLNDKAVARLVGYMQQEVNTGFGFSALEVVLAGRYPHLKWWANETDHDRAVARRYMEFTGVWHLADKSMAEVSGGERQRILLAKVLAQETPLIFLDEPTASLDINYQEEIFRYCQSMCRSGSDQKTALVIVHDIVMAAKFCSRLILLSGGTVIADGPPAEVITAGNLKQAYGLNAVVYNDKITGDLSLHTYTEKRAANSEKKIHIIGGGDAAADIIRLLYEEGYYLSGGVYTEGDTDSAAAEAFAVDAVRTAPFRNIGSDKGTANRIKIADADCVVLANLYFGVQNIDNLCAAFTAVKLIIIEDTPIEQRDFTDGAAVELYRELVTRPQVTVMTALQFQQLVHSGGLLKDVAAPPLYAAEASCGDGC